MLILQIINTVLSFVVMAVICLTFGANLQKAEQHLMLYNKELRQQALTAYHSVQQKKNGRNTE